MRPLGLAVLAGVALVGATGSPARAQYLVCDTTRCNGLVDCTGACMGPFMSTGCGPIDTGIDGRMGARSVCHPPCTTIFDCQIGLVPRCPVLGGVLGYCGGMADSFIAGLCRFPEWGITYCTAPDDSVTSARFQACHTSVDGTYEVATYLLGDCDGDHCANYVDPNPCVADGARCPPDPVDAIVCIAPESRPPPRPDAGVDAGALDAGAPVDAAGGLDATVVGDGGLDATASAANAPLGFQGGGGCVCRAATARGSSTRATSSGLATLAVLALVTLRRRRQR